MDFSLTEEQRMIQDLAREFADREIAPFSAQADVDKVFPLSIQQKALELGLLATAPISEGRYGLPILIAGQVSLLYILFDRWLGDPRAIVTHS